MSVSVLAPLVAAGSWWIIWPARSIRQYVELMADGKIEDSNSMMKPPQKWMNGPGGMLGLKPLEATYLAGNRSKSVWQTRFHVAASHLGLDSRTAADVLAARGTCTLWWPETTQESRGLLGLSNLQEGYELAVERGQITVSYKSRWVQ
jgi:hypothetical protein